MGALPVTFVCRLLPYRHSKLHPQLNVGDSCFWPPMPERQAAFAGKASATLVLSWNPE